VTFAAPAPGVRAARCADEVVLLDSTNARLHVLDATAALVWHCLDGETSIDELVHDITAVLGGDPAEVRVYVDALVALLASRELVVVDAAPVSAPLASA